MTLGWTGDVNCLAVVPVFFNAGAALLPAILAMAASILSLVFRPRDLLRAGAARPRTAALVVLGLVALGGAGTWWAWRAEAGPAPGKAGLQPSVLPLRSMPPIDWAAMARQWLRQPAAQGRRPNLPAAAHGQAVVFGVDPRRSGYLGGGSPLGLTPAWEFPTAGTPAAEELEGAMFLSSPALVGDAIYGGACITDLQGNFGTLVCLDAQTGAVRWTTSGFKDPQGKEHPFKGFFSSPAVTAEGKCLVIGQGLHNDDRCALLAVDTESGRLRWRVETPLHLEGSPAVDGDLAVAGAGAIEVGDDHHAQGHPGLVIAVEISTGRTLWEHQVNDPESSPVIADGVVYIGSGFNGKAVLALRSESDGELRARQLSRIVWQTPTPHPATGAVTLADDLVLVGCGNGDYVFADPHPDGVVMALDCRTGQVRWQVKMPDAVLGKIAVHGGRAIVPVRNGEVVALDLADSGRVLWRARVRGNKAILAGPAFTGSYVYAVSQDGCLAVLDAKDGKLLERHELNAPGKPGEMGLSLSSPLVALGRVYVGSETGGLRSFAGKEIRP